MTTKTKFSLSAPISTNLFPERNINCGLRITNADLHPRRYLESEPLSLNLDEEERSVVSLNNFIKGNLRNRDVASLVVCVAGPGIFVHGKSFHECVLHN
jgi:hypothetical protein